VLSKGSKFYALLQDGLIRVLSVAKSGKFDVFVNGVSLETTVAEAVLISPKIYELLQIDPTIRTFAIYGDDEDPDVHCDSFQAFLGCVHLREFLDFSPSNELMFLSNCRVL
jgi:hypothetical protein